MDRRIQDISLIRRAAAAIAAMAFLAVAVFVMYLMYCRGMFLPSRISWENRTIRTGAGLTLTLEQRTVQIRRDEELISSIGGKILVQDMLVTDLDRDGDEELLLLTWKRGQYGSSRPFWVQTNPGGWSQHIFIYDLHADGSLSNKWFSSDNGTDIRRFRVMDKNPQILLFEDAEGKCTLWRWESWGLKNMDNEVRFLAYGDNLIHDAIYGYADREEGGRYDFLYEDEVEEIGKADLAALQLETILVDDPAAVSSYPYFGTPLAVGEAICDAGFDIVSCAGNHAADKGIYGIDITEAFFTERGVSVLGIQNSTDREYIPCRYISRNGIRFALFDYTYGTTVDMREKYPYAVHYLEEEQIRKDIAECEADCKVVFVHWGTEYADQPDAEQQRYAELFAELGVDVVIGTHPHVIQDAVLLNGPGGHQTLVAYSLGNFRAQQSFEERAMRGGRLSFTMEHCWDGVRIREWSLEEFKIPGYR